MASDSGTEDHHEPEKIGPPGLAGEFEKQILESDASRLEGAWVSFESIDDKISGEVIEIYDGPRGIRHISIEQESGRVRAIPLWFLDGVFEGWDHERGQPTEDWNDE